LSQVGKSKNAVISGLATGVSIALVILGLVYVSNILKPWITIQNMEYVAAALGLTLVLAYLLYPAKRGAPRNNLPWYDILFIIFSLCGTGYIVFFGESWVKSILLGYANTGQIVLCLLLMVAILEATRRSLGIALSVIAAGFLLYIIFGTNFGLDRIIDLIYFLPSGILGTPVTVTFTIIIMFLLFGVFIQKSEAGKFMIDGALGLTGRWTGGPAKAAVVASAALGTVTGIGPANAAVTGSITIPIMKQCGYKSEFAAAVEAVASNGGAILPPVMGIVAFIMAEILGTTYWSVCIAAFIPALLYYLGVFMQVHFEAAKFRLMGLPRGQLPSLVKTVKQGWFYLLPLILLVYFLAVVGMPAQHAGMYAALSVLAVILIAGQGRKATRKKPKEIITWLVDTAKETGRQLVMPAMACAAAGIIIACLSASGIGFKIATLLLNIAGGNMLALLCLVALFSFVLGMGMPALPTYLVLAILVAPTLIELGAEPMAAHLFILYWGLTSLITPPVAITAFVAAGIAQSDPWRTGWLACRLGILTFILPFIFIYNPELLVIGSTGEIILAAVTAIIGVVFLAAGVEAFLLKRMNWLEVVLFIAGAGLLLWPGWHTDIWGAAIIAVTLLWHIRAARRVSSST
jgi:TRAP transporter 4TM/12TM fusion protein